MILYIQCILFSISSQNSRCQVYNFIGFWRFYMNNKAVNGTISLIYITEAEDRFYTRNQSRAQAHYSGGSGAEKCKDKMADSYKCLLLCYGRFMIPGRKLLLNFILVRWRQWWQLVHCTVTVSCRPANAIELILLHNTIILPASGKWPWHWRIESPPSLSLYISFYALEYWILFNIIQVLNVIDIMQFILCVLCIEDRLFFSSKCLYLFWITISFAHSNRK